MQEEKNIKEDSITKTLISKWFWLYFFWYLSAPLWYIIRIIISNSPDVSPHDIWILYGIISLITFLYTYNDLWLTGSLQYFLPRFKIHNKYNNIKFTIYFSLAVEIITWILIAIWLRFWSDRLALNYFHDESASKILKYFCFYFFWTNILQVIQSIFKSLQKTFEYKLTEFIKVFSILIFSVVFFLINRWNIEYYSIARVWGIFIAVIIWIFLYKKYRKNLMQWNFKWNQTIFKEYTKYALRSFIWINITRFSWQIILQMVLYFLGPENAWYYSSFLSLFNMGTTLLWPILLIICPLTSELIEKSSEEKLQQLLSIFYNYFSIAVLCLSLIFITYWPEIATVLFWEKYLQSWLLLSCSWIFLIFKQLWVFNYSVLSWIWKVREKVFITTFTCIITIFIAYILIKYWWIYWATIAFGLSLISMWLVSLSIIKKKIKILINIKLLIKNIIILFLYGNLIYILKSQIISLAWDNRIFLWLLIILISLILWGIIVLINKKDIMNLIKNR